MILLDIKNHIAKAKVTNLYDLCRRFNAGDDLMRDMLAIWMRKGKICKLAQLPGCGSACVKCDPRATEVYKWVA